MSEEAGSTVPQHIHDWVKENTDIVDQWIAPDGADFRAQMLSDIEAGHYEQYNLSEENVNWIRDRLGGYDASEVALRHSGAIGMY